MRQIVYTVPFVKHATEPAQGVVMARSNSTPTGSVTTAIRRLELALEKRGHDVPRVVAHPRFQTGAGRFEQLYQYARTVKMTLQEIAEVVRWDASPPGTSTGFGRHVFEKLRANCP